MMEVVTADGSKGVELGPQPSRIVHRVAVAIGSGGAVPLESRDHGAGFVHVFDEATLFTLLSELDTITDFVEYLRKREQLLTTPQQGTIIGSEEDLLVAYYFGVHSFDKLQDGAYDLRVIAGSWDDFTDMPEYKAKKEADEISYVWDQLISKIHDDYANGDMDFGGDLKSVDGITRTMAREPRFYRRYLSEAFTEFMEDPMKKSRFMLGDSGIGYVFLKQKHAEPRKDRIAELHARAYVMRDKMEELGRPGVVVGIATEFPEKGSGFSLDLLLLDFPEWTAELHQQAVAARDDFDLFKSSELVHRSGDEFPQT